MEAGTQGVVVAYVHIRARRASDGARTQAPRCTSTFCDPLNAEFVLVQDKQIYSTLTRHINLAFQYNSDFKFKE